LPPDTQFADEGAWHLEHLKVEQNHGVPSHPSREVEQLRITPCELVHPQQIVVAQAVAFNQKLVADHRHTCARYASEYFAQFFFKPACALWRHFDVVMNAAAVE